VKHGFSTQVAVVFVATVGLVLTAESISPDARKLMIRENGIVETLSAVGFLAAFALLLWQTASQHNRWSLAVATLCLGMRELDFHKRFTTTSMFKTRFYTASEVPGMEKVVGLLCIFALFALICFLMTEHFSRFREGLRSGDKAAWTVFLVACMLICAKSIDGLGRKLEPLGIELTEAGRQVSGSIEEVLEMSAAMLLLSAVIRTTLRRFKHRLPQDAEVLPFLQRSK
jgi:hypothetical protein